MNEKNHKINLSGKSIYILSVIALFLASIFMGFNLTIKSAHAEDILVYKSPTCGCCKKWVKHLENNGFNVKTKDIRDMSSVKNKFGVKKQFQSCHTAKIGNYFIEGHVSASDIKKLLKDKPDIKGLSVPGMPMGSPGMEGHRKDKYNVIAIDKNNKSTVYSKH